MKVYSKNLEAFLERLLFYTKEILREEFNVTVKRTRFLLPNGYTYPITLYLIEDRKLLGQFSHRDLTLSFNRHLVYSAKPEIIKDIIRHELAHYFTYIHYRNNVSLLQPHGVEFRETCKRYHLDERVAKATIDIREANQEIEGDLQTERFLHKVEKLLKLTQSTNSFEASLALTRANQLITQYNLKHLLLDKETEDSERYYIKLVIESKKKTAKLQAIYQIIREFMVYPVFATGMGLEVTGTKNNVENAQYIANFLNIELSQIWKKEKKLEPSLKQKPFMMALADSFCQNLQQEKSQLSSQEQTALIKLNRDLQLIGKKMYYNLSSQTHFLKEHSLSKERGKSAGKKLSILKALDPFKKRKLLN